LVFGNRTADVFAPKFQWFGDWIFTFAGALASTDLIVEQVRLASLDPKSAERFTRRHILRTVVSAFNRRVECWSAIRHVSMFGMDAEQFRKEGRNVFGEKMHAELARAMHNDAQKNFEDQLMIVGWGEGTTPPTSLLIHSIGIAGDKSHTRDGHGAIGSGRRAAIDTILQLKHGLHSSLQDAIYTAAAAKFSAESKMVGRDTAIFVTRRRTPQDSKDAVVIPVQPEQVETFRKIWRKTKSASSVPQDARIAAEPIVALTKDEEVIKRNSQERNVNQLIKLFKQQSDSQKSKPRE
jgi:hypothetical protein